MTWTISAGSLPPGLTINATTGLISGTPTTAGNFAFTVTASDAATGSSGNRAYTVVIANPQVGSPLTITPAALPAGTVGVAYSVQLVASPAGPAGPARVNGMLYSDHIINTPIDRAPVLPNSAAIVAQVLAQASAASRPARLKPCFDMPLNYGSYALKPVLMDDTSGQSSPGPYALPDAPATEGGADNHCLVVDIATNRLYELWQYRPGPPIAAGSGAIFDLAGYALRTLWDTSADGAGLPLAPFVVQFSEFAGGAINHALRMTVQRSRRWGYYGGLAFGGGDADTTQAGNQPPATWPARHRCGTETDPATPSMGERFRLQASFDDSALSAETRVFTAAMKRYGLIVADNGYSGYFNCDSDPRWQGPTSGSYTNLVDKLVTEIRDRVPFSALEVVDGVTNYIISADSGQARQ